MTPLEAKAWLKEFLPNRDSILWSLCFWLGLVGLIGSQFPDRVKDLGFEWALPWMKDAGGVSALIGAKMGWSWAGTPARVAGPGTLPGTPPAVIEPQQVVNATRTVAVAEAAGIAAAAAGTTAAVVVVPPDVPRRP
jgi:hypothetical protein